LSYFFAFFCIFFAQVTLALSLILILLAFDLFGLCGGFTMFFGLANCIRGWLWQWLGGSGWVAVGEGLSNGTKMSQIGAVLSKLH
jgi:hypothetical protein